MFTHMRAIKKVGHSARDKDYELLVYQVTENGEYKIFITDGEVGIGDIYSASEEVVADSENVDIVEELINLAKGDIDKNEFDQY